MICEAVTKFGEPLDSLLLHILHLAPNNSFPSLSLRRLYLYPYTCRNERG